MTDYPHVPAAFINAIAEEGTKAEAVEYLQKQWNEVCALRSAAREVWKAVERTPDHTEWFESLAKLRAALELRSTVVDTDGGG